MNFHSYRLIPLLIVTLFFVSSCQRSDQSESVWRDASTYEGPAVKNDWMVTQIGASPSILNPVLSSDLYATQVEDWIFDQLIRPNYQTGEPIGSLASSWTVSENGLTYDFFIRENAKFHDGTPLTAEDVRFSFDIIKDPNVDAAHLQNYYAALDRVEVIGPHHLRFHMNDRYYRNLIVLGTTKIMPKHIYGEGNFNQNPANRAPVGSGPYRFLRWDTGRMIELERTEDWWGTEVPYWKDRYNFDRILVRIITENSVASMATRRGEIDVIEPLPEQFVDDFSSPEIEERFYRLQFSTMDGAGYRYVGWNLKKEVFSDRRVRQALAHAFPADLINQRVFKGIMRQAVGPFPKASPKTHPDLKPYAFDEARAAQLLDEAGWKRPNPGALRQKDGKNFEFGFMYVANNPTLDRLALIYQRTLADLGIRMNLRTLEWTVFLENMNDGNFDAIMLSWSSSWDSDPFQIWHSTQYANRGSNRIAFSNKRVDQLLEKARITLDREERNLLYQEFTKIIHEETPYLFVFERPELLIVNRRMQGVEPVGKMGPDIPAFFTPPGFERYGRSGASASR
ncbi:MAG: hypothetical protein EA369_04920 [Bradymonadales bacterium]|nr:MAG: hypothetical protein EA369_04920 [Bradymonadales bacterium]